MYFPKTAPANDILILFILLLSPSFYSSLALRVTITDKYNLAVILLLNILFQKLLH